MGVVSKLGLESWIAIMITLMACFTRLSMAAGQIFLCYSYFIKYYLYLET